MGHGVFIIPFIEMFYRSITYLKFAAMYWSPTAQDIPVLHHNNFKQSSVDFKSLIYDNILFTTTK